MMVQEHRVGDISTLLRTRPPALDDEPEERRKRQKSLARSTYARKRRAAVQAIPLIDCVDSDLLSAAGTCVGKSRERPAQDAFEALVSAVNVVSFLGEDSTDVTLAKAETSQGSEGLGS
jgi:hypothetical protein